MVKMTRCKYQETGVILLKMLTLSMDQMVSTNSMLNSKTSTDNGAILMSIYNMIKLTATTTVPSFTMTP